MGPIHKASLPRDHLCSAWRLWGTSLFGQKEALEKTGQGKAPLLK